MSDSEPSPEDVPHEEIQLERRSVAKTLAAVSGVGAVGSFSVSALAGLSDSGKVEEPEPLFVEGVKLVDGDGNTLSVADALPSNDELEKLTVYPQKEGGSGPIEEKRAEVLLVRFPQDSYKEPTNVDGTIQGYAAYSKVCTHLGCRVTGVDDENALFHCPCHGSKFDPLQGAKVATGPAARPLPQLPIGATQDGNELLIATGPFEGPVGAKG